MIDYDDMMDMKYGEENPGYQREIAYIPDPDDPDPDDPDPDDPDPDDPDRDPEIEALVADKYAHDNAKRRANNLRTENDRLRALLEEHGIDPNQED